MSRMMDIAYGGSSLAKGLSDADKQQIESLIDEMKPVIKLIEDKDSVHLDITQAVIGLEERLKKLLAGWQLPAGDKPEEAGGDDFAG